MGGFSGFSEVRDELERSFRDQLVTVAMTVEGYDHLPGREYMTGHSLHTGLPVRATLADRRGYPGRPSISDHREHLGGATGTVVLVDAWFNRNGVYEASNILTFGPNDLVLMDGVASVGAPRRRDDGRWGQSIQHLRLEGATPCQTYADLAGAALAALGEPGPGRAGALVRGWHAETASLMMFEIGQVFDPARRAYAGADESFDAFLATPDVYIQGIGARASGAATLEIVDRLIGRHGDVAWEVIPKRTYAMGSFAAEAAGLRTGRDASAAYRRRDHDGFGYLPSVVAFVCRNGTLWPRTVAPMRYATPQPISCIATTALHLAAVEPSRQPGPSPRTVPSRPQTSFASEESPPLPPDLVPGDLCPGPVGTPPEAEDELGAVRLDEPGNATKDIAAGMA